MAVQTEIEWRGAEQQRLIAQEVWKVLSFQARFYSQGAAVRRSLEELQAYLGSVSAAGLPETSEERAALIEDSLTANSHVFAREQTEDGVAFATTKAGVPPHALDEPPDNKHTFRSRLFEGSRTPTEEDLQAVRGIPREIPDILVAAAQPSPDAELEITTQVPDFAVFEPEEFAAPATTEPDAVEELDTEPEPALAPAEAPTPTVTELRLGDTLIDLTQGAELISARHGELFERLLGDYIEQDFRFVQFGEEYYVEDRLERLSKGQLRDIRDYILERNEPVTDEEILSDGLRRPLQNAEYELWRFTINFRLSREKKDFRFVGALDDRLWATTNLPPIGQSVRKPSEIATDYRYLADPQLGEGDVVAPASGQDAGDRLELRHVLTWYESENGVLPVSKAAEQMMPKPLLEDQNVVVLRIQDPQNYGTYLAELRFGASGKGTYIAGLEELFQSSLVPGAVFSLVQGSASNEFTIEYERQAAQESRLLQYDERKNRWFFGPVLFECAVEPSQLLSEENVGNLSGRKRANETERKKPEVLLQVAFETVGEPGEGGTLTALVDDLLPVMNIERPFSRPYIESILTGSQYPQFSVEDEAVGLAQYKPE
jgi:hypothetical protein